MFSFQLFHYTILEKAPARFGGNNNAKMKTSGNRRILFHYFSFKVYASRHFYHDSHFSGYFCLDFNSIFSAALLLARWNILAWFSWYRGWSCVTLRSDVSLNASLKLQRRYRCRRAESASNVRKKKLNSFTDGYNLERKRKGKSKLFNSTMKQYWRNFIRKSSSSIQTQWKCLN